VAIPARCDSCSGSSGARASIGREFVSDDLSGDTLNFYTRESSILRKRGLLLASEQLSRHPDDRGSRRKSRIDSQIDSHSRGKLGLTFDRTQENGGSAEEQEDDRRDTADSRLRCSMMHDRGGSN